MTAYEARRLREDIADDFITPLLKQLSGDQEPDGIEVYAERIAKMIVEQAEMMVAIGAMRARHPALQKR